MALKCVFNHICAHVHIKRGVVMYKRLFQKICPVFECCVCVCLCVRERVREREKQGVCLGLDPK